MMFMNTFIHILEGITALLVLLLLFQVVRCYRAYVPPSRYRKPQPVNSHSPVLVEKSAIGGSEAILNDYIGGFFAGTDDTHVDIQAYKAPVSPLFMEKESVEKVAVEKEIEEDSIITVMPSAAGETGRKTEKVMTDKVVHAMLDEAKLVCAS